MKTIEIDFSTDEWDTPKNLVNIASLEDIEKIYKVGNALKDVAKDVFSFAVDVVLFDIPEDCEFRYDVAYVRCYIGLNGEISAYQYFQNKWDASSQIESERIDLEVLKEYLTAEVSA